MKQIFAFLLFILFISLSQESNKDPNDNCRRIHYGGCRFPYIFGCRDGRWGCYPGPGFKKIMKTTKTTK